MATDLRCPRCQGPLSADSASCPQCSGSSTRSGRASRIVAAKPFKAPPGWVVPEATSAPSLRPTECPPSSRSWIAAPIAAVVGLLVLFGGWFWLTARKLDVPAADVVVSAAPVVSDLTSVSTPVPPVAPPLFRAPMPEVEAASTDTKPVRKVRTISGRSSARPAPAVRPVSTLPISASVSAAKVDAAIQRGVAWFREHPGEWLTGDHSLGRIALPGLALLESGVAPDDPQIQSAAERVRKLAPSHMATYEISLAILFLDRLGDPADESLIQRLGARLIAGQTTTYGWSYTSRLLPRGEEMPLLKALEAMRPEVDLSMPLRREPGKGLIELEMPLAAGPGSSSTEPAKRREPKMMLRLDVSADAEKLVRELPRALQNIPALDPETTRKPWRSHQSGGDDNSNTQFAMLALWTAHRHGVSVERSLLLADQRFAQTQLRDGSWAYHIQDTQSKAAMTCVGLLGLAVGHGALLRSESPARAVEDRAIRSGLDALSRWIGAWEDRDDNGRLNLYKLWSIERVCVLYGLPTIAGKDWYGWGAKRLLREQGSNGSWRGGGYHGSTTMIDTAFALLFLRRSNLVQDLTDRLQLQMPIRELEAGRDRRQHATTMTPDPVSRDAQRARASQ